MIFDHYLAVATWSPDFVSSAAKIEKTLVRVPFPGMNLVYYDESLLLAMAAAIGRPIKVDRQTLRVERGRFARVCVDIDLNQPIVGKFWMRERWYHVEYEGLHVICVGCGCYGHLTRNCSVQKEVPVAKEMAAAAGASSVEIGNMEGARAGLILGDSQAKSKEEVVNVTG